MAKILIVDDDRQLNKVLCRFIVKKADHEVKSCLHLKEALEMANREKFDVVFLDVQMPDGDGLKALPEFKRTKSEPEVVIMTAYADSVGAEIAIENHAWDYIKKPFDSQEALSALGQALQYREDKRRAISRKSLSLDGIVGSGPAMQKAYENLARCAFWDGNVLLTGETGTGKELFARAIHENSSRASGPFVAVDCAVLPENLVESWLFGHEKGSFTGADIPRKGLIREAHRGTLFLDEVGELSPAIQQKFLRVLETRRYKPVGAIKEIECDFRLVAATNRDPDRMVRRKTFRKDLFYRLRGTSIHLPPLRDRMEDIPDLVKFLLRKIADKKGAPVPETTAEFMECLKNYSWPGNVRELSNVLESATAKAAESGRLLHYHIPADFRIRTVQKAISNSESERAVCGKTQDLPDRKELPPLKEYRKIKMAKFEKEYLEKLMIECGGSIPKAREISGVSKSRLYKLLRIHRVGKKTKDQPARSRQYSRNPHGVTG